MPISVDAQIKELNDAKSKRAELKGLINTCNKGISMLRKEGNLTYKKPRVDIAVKDDYTDGDYWDSAGITLYNLPTNLTETLIQIFETEKNRIQRELDALERKYTF